MSVFSVLGALLKPVLGIVDKAVVDKDKKIEIKAALLQLEASLQEKLLEYESALAQARSEVVLAEIKSESWITRSWRPILMLTFGFLVVYAIALGPIFSAPPIDPTLIPEPLWDILKIGIGGYIIGRSTEKGIKLWRKNGSS